MKGGYYRVDINDQISLLSLNGIVFNRKQGGDPKMINKVATA